MMKSANLKVRIYPQEKEYLASLAKSARISLSELIRRILVGIRLPSPGNYDAIKGIVKVNADLARLGNLLKLALDDKRTRSEKIDSLIDDIAEDRKRLKQTLDTIKDHRKVS